MEQLKAWYRGLQPRERTLVTVAGSVLAIALIYVAVLGPLGKKLDTLQTRVEHKQQDLVWMRGISNTVRMLAATRPGAAGGDSLVVLVNRTAQQSALTSALTNQAPQGENKINVRLEGANFDSLVAWLGTLEQQYGVQAENASVDRADKTGIVNASLLLTRGVRQ